MARIRLTLAVLGSILGFGGNAYAQEPVTIGVLTDLSGIFSDITGKGSVLAAQMAIDKFGGKVNGQPIRLLSGDHLHKPEVGSGIARQWIDVEKVDAIVDMPNSGVLLAIQEVVRNASRGILLASGGQSSAFANEACSPYGFQWTTNSFAITGGLATLAQQPNAKTWFLIQPDYAFGEAAARDLEKAIVANGGKVVGKVKHPLNNNDFASYLLQAQASKADVIGLLNGASDLINSVKQATDFGITKTQKLAAVSLYITEVPAIGLNVVQGLVASDGYYWDQSPQAREWSLAFMNKHGKPPTAVQIGVYSAVLHFLKSVEAGKSSERGKVIAGMRALPVNDEFVKDGKLREDGLMVHDMLLSQVKTPAESTGTWDVFKVLRVIPGNEAYDSLANSRCPLLKKG